MFLFCIESSHERGMGHLYRSITFINYLMSIGERCMVIVNDHEVSTKILSDNGIVHQVEDLSDYKSDWEGRAVKRYNITRWINDRLDTEYQHAKNVKNAGALLVTFDDRGAGASISDVNISALVFKDKDKLQGYPVKHL